VRVERVGAGVSGTVHQKADLFPTGVVGNDHQIAFFSWSLRLPSGVFVDMVQRRVCVIGDVVKFAVYQRPRDLIEDNGEGVVEEQGQGGVRISQGRDRYSGPQSRIVNISARGIGSIPSFGSRWNSVSAIANGPTNITIESSKVRPTLGLNRGPDPKGCTWFDVFTGTNEHIVPLAGRNVYTVDPGTAIDGKKVFVVQRSPPPYRLTSGTMSRCSFVPVKTSNQVPASWNATNPTGGDVDYADKR